MRKPISLIVASLTLAAGASPPQFVNVDAWGDGTAIGTLEDYERASVSGNADGGAVVAFFRDGDVRCSSFSAGSWTNPVRLPAPAGTHNENTVALAMNGGGAFTAVNSVVAAQGAPRAIYALHFDGASWSPPTQLTQEKQLTPVFETAAGPGH